MKDNPLDAIYLALEEGDLERAGTLLGRATQATPNDPDLWYAWAELDAEHDDAKAAEQHLLKAIEIDPKFSDAHHALGRVYEELGDREKMIAHDLLVLALDEAVDEEAGLGSPEELDLLTGEAEWVLSQLPEELRTRVANVPVVLEARPPKALVQEGFDPRALGLFEGENDHESHAKAGSGFPSRIVLFYANLLAQCLDEDELKEEVKITILHELGHYFGLSEEQVAELGLE